MKEERLGQEPAFPTKLNQVIGQTSYNFTDEKGNGQIAYHNNYADIVYQGMSKRFYAACTAMQGLLVNSHPVFVNAGMESLIKQAYYAADELLRQEEL